MVDWNAVQCFVSVAQLGSLTEAGRVLGLSVATLSRRIDLLESQTGAVLLRRGPNGTQLTEAGITLFAHAESGARHIGQFARAARTLQAGPEQIPVRITATEAMIADVLAPRVSQLLSTNPTLKLELDVSNAQSDLNAGEADIAIRMVRPTSETLVTRKLPVIHMGLYCSKDYLGRRKPNRIRLQDERLIWLAKSFGPIAENQWLIDQELQTAVVMRASSVRALHNAVATGIGIAPLPCFSADAAGLIRLPAPDFAQRHPWLVFHRDTRNSRRMQRVRRWILDACKESFG